MHKTLHL